MYKDRIILFLLLILCLEGRSQARVGLSRLPEMVNTEILGAPRLGVPILIETEVGPVVARGFGLAAPAFFDFDGDDLKDLLVGEFCSGVENPEHISMGSFVRVFKNKGTKGHPMFSDRFYYAGPPFEYQALGNGTPYSVAQFCCMGFTPQFADLNKDGYHDMITGQYQGEVSWFEGTDKGFLPGKALVQDGGNPRGQNTIDSTYYWLYSSASVGDFTGDGLDDLIIGGKSLRISRNVGTKGTPHFAKRELLLDIDGMPLQVYDYLPEDWESQFSKGALVGGARKIPEAGDPKLSPYVVDWDNDGILDLLVTNSYSHAGLSVVDFFKGVKLGAEHRFQKPKPLFTAKDNSKAFPGSGPRVFVTDYNSDGINDLLLGASVASVNGRLNDRLTWTWEKELELHGAGKDPGFISFSDETLKWYKATTKIPSGIEFDDFVKIGHVGYVYVMLGSLESNQEKNDRKSKKRPNK